MKIGCNYWASNAGINMWLDWDADAIDKDFEIMSDFGIEILRVFPLWPVFHNLEPIYGGGGKLLGICGGIDTAAMEKFGFIVQTAEKYGISLIVSLINGWMSGRLFVPEPFYNRNVLTDPEAIKYQVEFITKFINKFKDKKEISAWDLGNECNVMGEVASSSQAWLWMKTISSAIKNADNTRPVYAGMHGLTLDGTWKISDAADCCDVLTTHPYPLFTPHCGKDSLGEGRSIFHAVAESRYYSDISGKPCIIEELGSLGPNVSSNEATADYLRKVLGLAAEEGIEEVLWWCAFDQPFDYPPYGQIALERELGLFTADRKPKQAAFVIKDFEKIEIENSKADAICLLTEGQDHWLTAYGSYILARQEGIIIKFADATAGIPDSPVYFMPCITGYNVISKAAWENVLEKVAGGAVLYISYDGGFLSGFEDVAGIRINSRRGQENPVADISPTVCEVVVNNTGGPILTHNDYSAGKVIFCSLPIENTCALNEEYKISIVYKKMVGLWMKNA